MFEQLFNSPFLYSLSLTLVHFLWQGLLVALILKSVLFIVDKNKPKLRYALATLAMLTNAILALLTFTMVYPDTSSAMNSNLSPIPLTNLVNELTQQNALLTYQELIPSILAYSLPYLSLLWLTTIAILASKLLIEIRNVNNLPMHTSVSPSSELLARFNELAKQIKLTKPPKLLISLKAEVPMAIGWLKPVVLLPATMVTGLDSAQLEMLILHELAHIRRHDYLVNFFQTLIELLFFFHPSVHWIGKQMRNEREYCSDDIAVQHCGDAIAYAHTLTDTASLCARGHHHTIPTMAMAASGGDLKARVLRLVDHHCAPTNNASKWLAALSLLLALTLLSINQLLTMPFSQQLNNQFPWQDNNTAGKSIFQPSIAAANRKPTKVLTNDSIAQQLLYSDKNITDIPLLSLEDTPNFPSLALSSEMTQTPAVIEPLSLVIPQPAIELTSYSNQEVGQPNNTRSEQIAAVAPKEKPAKAVSPRASENLVKHRVSIEKQNLQSAAEEKISTVKLAKTQVTLPPIKTVPITKPSPVNTEMAAQKFTYKDKVGLPTTYNDNLANRSSAYQQLSYRQEINTLALENDLYLASSQSSTLKDIVFETKAIQLASENFVEPPVSLEAKLLNDISPVYPSLAKRRGIEMEVKVNFTIDRKGRVKNINFAQQSKLIYFKSSIRSAIRKWRFSPATKNNRNVESKMSKIFSFSLEA